MQRRNGRAIRPRDEAHAFRFLLREIREHLGWTQEQLGLRLGASRRTISNWENGYWLPPFKQRLHVVLALREVPPEYVLDIADALGVSTDAAVAPLLKQFQDAYDAYDTKAAAPAPAAAPPKPRPTSDQLRAAMDAVVREAADALDARPNDVRGVIARALAACHELGATLEETQTAAAPAPKPEKKPND